MVSNLKRFLSFALMLLCVINDGSAWAQTISAPFLDMMKGNSKEHCEAELKRLEPLAEKGDTNAQTSLGLMHSLGDCRNYKIAVRWLQLAATQGSTPARHRLDLIYSWYYVRSGLPRDDNEAVVWFKDAASHSDWQAQSILGQMYLSGYKIVQDYSEAAKWLKLAAANGQKNAQLRLGQMYEEGLGVPKDSHEAIFLYESAAAQGLVDANLVLGMAYDVGEIVPRDDKKSTDWYRLAAAGGNERAQYLLGQRFMLGLGVPEDYIQAHMWLNLSAAQGNADAAQKRDSVAQKMTGWQVPEAQKLARECLARNYKDCGL